MHRNEKKSLARRLTPILVLLAVLALLVPLTATAGGGKGKHGKKHHKAVLEQLDDATREEAEALHEWTRAQLELSHHYMQEGDYATAAAHIDTVLNLQLDPAFEAKLEAARESVKAEWEAKRAEKKAARGDTDGDRDDEARDGKRRRRGKRGDHAKGPEGMRLKLYMMSARAHALAGDQDTAMLRLDEGIAKATELGSERMVEKLEKLKAEPDKLLKERRHRDADPAELETKIRETEGKLPTP